MQRRRERILTQARSIIAERGFESFNVRDLARAAEVTVPTLYNLIGNKSAILRHLMADLVEQMERIHQLTDTGDPLASAEMLVSEMAGLIADDEDSCRAAFLAGQQLERSGDPTPSRLFARSARISLDACRSAHAQGLLRGNVDPKMLGEQLYGCYRTACLDWVNRNIELDVFRTNALLGLYLCLAADASPKFRARLIRRIGNLEADGAASPA
jgi:AcrR family transcriptional regulator